MSIIGPACVALFLWGAGFLSVQAALAHHIRGLPHYSYKSSYPETPVYEEVKQIDQYLVTFTYYKIPGQKALDLAIYIRNRASKEPFAEPVNLHIFGKHEDPKRTRPFTAYRNPTNVYKVGWVYEDGGDYYVRVTFKDDAGVHNALFELSVGGGNRAWYLLAGSVLLVVAFAAIVGIVRRRRLDARRR